MSKHSPFVTQPPLPPPDLHERKLPVVAISKHSDWFRIFKNNFKKPEAKHFGRSKENRFDAPKKDFGVLYLADSIHCSIAEVWLRDPNPAHSVRVIAESELRIRSIATFKTVEVLNLVDLVGDGLSRLGLDAAIFATRDYKISRAWSSAFHAHPYAPDGILYRSRLNPSLRCIALFDRAGKKVVLTSEERLDCKAGQKMIIHSLRKYGIGII